MSGVEPEEMTVGGERMNLPLSNIKVVDFSQVLAGPATTQLLADQGAEVIKIEPPEGDSGRHYLPIPNSNGLSQGYVALNRNKRNIVLDLAIPNGLEVAHRLARWADVAVCNLRVSVPQRLGIAYEDLVAVNPRIVYASITAYGEKGPDATLPGYDLVVQAKSGITANRRMSDGTPIGSSIFYADMAGAMLASYAIMVALHERELTGRGQKVEVNLLHVYLALQAAQMIKVPNYNPPAQGRKPAALATPYRGSDGMWIHIHAATDRQWRSLCRALQLNHLLEDADFATPEKRREQAEVIYDILFNLIATKPAREWETILKAGNSPCSVVQEVEDVWQDPQILANDMFLEFDQPELGPISVVNTPFHMSGSVEVTRFRRPAPHMGEHTEEIISELGYSEIEIAALRSEGVFGYQPYGLP
jgi:CoA:oxalate CoA-transferase